jgi:hypothetical protein
MQMFEVRTFALFPLLAAGVSASAAAMEFTVVREPGLPSNQELVSIEAVGTIDAGDDEKFIAAADEAMAELSGEATRPTVKFDSGGGHVGAGLLIGLAIRERDLPTFIPEGKMCASACTFAFIGGTDRRILGSFEIHAMAPDPNNPDAFPETGEEFILALDDVQEASTILLAYARDMLGDSTVMEEALLFGSQGIAVVPDELLRDWSVITHAMRDTQRFEAASGALSRCGEAAWLWENVAPRDVLCRNLEVARKYMEINEALAELEGQPLGGEMAGQQESFERSWEACQAPVDLPASIWAKTIETCVAAAFDARWRELKALVEFYAIGASEPAASGWKTIP